VWRVGNGEKINIWQDPWIPSSPNGKIITPRGAAVYTKVSDLIDPITEQWDSEILEALLSPVDVHRILQIPLHNRGFEDFIAWRFTKHGKYTVRSGYHVQWRHRFGASAGQLALPGSSALNPVWKSVWKLKIPSKIKIFFWRALHGILPLKCIMANRHVGTSSECPICHQGPEDILHLLFQCSAAREVWVALGIHSMIDEAIMVDRSGSAVLEEILCRNPTLMPGFNDIGLKEVVVITSWYIWWVRRRRTRNEDVAPIFKRKMSILAIASNSAKAMTSCRPSTDVRWSKPLPRQVKVNVDASFFEDSRSGAVGAVLRDYQGQFIAASCKFIPHVNSAMMAEAMTMKEGLNLAISKGCNSVIAEGDSMETIQACSGSDVWWTEPAAIYADCVDLATQIGQVSFIHCQREANMCAHVIARESFNSRSSCT
jgi:ribonuclease HI